MRKKPPLVRYLPAIAALVLFAIFIAFWPEHSGKAIDSIWNQASTMLLVLPPIFIILGLFDVWVPREKFIRFMGPGSGAKGPLLAFALGTCAAGPLYGSFPVAAALMRKGASFMNVMIFIGAWSTTKIPMLLFEIQSLGPRFALSRLAIDIPGIVLIAYAMKQAVKDEERRAIYERAESFGADIPGQEIPVRKEVKKP
jgi:uncharacterized membrane protein YraQ (UPF0718 family)